MLKLRNAVVARREIQLVMAIMRLETAAMSIMEVKLNAGAIAEKISLEIPLELMY